MKKVNLISLVSKSLAETFTIRFKNQDLDLLASGRNSVTFTLLFLMSIVGQWFSTPAVYAAEGVCGSCSYQVSVTGDFAHYKADESVSIKDGSGDVSAFYEEIYGQEFSVSVMHLPVDTYTIIIGETELFVRSPGERVFSVTCGDVTLAENFDIYSVAGGMGKICYITGQVEHTGDELRGPVQVVFKAIQENAKFNTFEIKNSTGESVLKFKASDIADPFFGDAVRIPDINEPAIWRDPDKPLHERINDLIRRMSLAEKVAQIQNDAPAIERLKLPAYNYWNEALHGVANNGIATVFPEPVGMASTWNPELLHREGTVIGIEGRAKFNDYASRNNGNSKWWTGLTYWTPNINIFRDPRWGRGQETYGEDPFLTGELAVGFIKGLQGDHPDYMLAMACTKHYAVHSGPEQERHRFNAEPPERDFYETYLPQFERAIIGGGVAGVMTAYNAVYGVPCSASKLLLQDLLRGKWGFEGYVVSDCGAIGDMSNRRGHAYVDTAEKAAALGVKSGVNLCCGSEYNALVKAVQQGLLGEKEIDEALYCTLWTRFRLGLFDPPEKVPFNKYSIRDNDTPEHAKVALEVARQSLVLLKNDGILPLDRSRYKRIAVIGPNGNSKSMLEGNYHGSASHPISILDGIKQLAGDGIEITYAIGSPVTTKPGTAAWSRQDNETDRPVSKLKTEALEHAANADLIIYVGGITPAQEGEGFDRDSIELPEVQSQLLRALYAAGKPIVMVNCSGSAIALTWEDEHLPAILQAWYPGQNGGQAVAEVLFGEINPSGRLPITFYRATSDLPDFRNYSMENRTYKYFQGKPLYAFGHGLSYTTFEYKGGKLASEKIPANGIAKLSFTIENTGRFDGDDVAQVYFRHVNPSVPQPKLALCGFARVHVKKGQSKQVTVEVPAEQMRYWDTQKKQYVVEPGNYEILVGAASDDIRLELPLKIVSAGGMASAAENSQTETILLSALDVSRVEQSWGQARSNRSVDNRHLQIAGQQFQNGIGTHANSEIPLLLDGKGVELSGLAGLDDETHGRGSVVFKITADGKEVWSSGLMKPGDAAKGFSIDVRGVKTLSLLALDAGDGYDWDHADWVDLKMTLIHNAKPKLDIPPIEDAVILTPKPASTPRINGAKVFGVRPGSPFLFRIAAAGDRPMMFSADGLPSGLSLDSKTGQITGTLKKPGKYKVMLHAKNALGRADQEFGIVCGSNIGLTPAMGWNSWNCFAASVTAEKIKAAADAMVESGLINHGWTYINIDDFWQVHRDSDDPTLQGPKRDSEGRILPNPRFPDMKGLVDYVHSKGLKIGIYSGPGPWTCGGCVGSFDHELQDAQQYAEWGFDYLKYDWCSYNPAFEAYRGVEDWDPSSVPNITYTGGDDLTKAKIPFERMYEALSEQPRDIIYGLCQYGMGNVWEWGAQVGGNSWRTTQDINDSWGSMSGIGFRQAGLEKYAGPGHFNDPDMLVIGKVGWGPQLRDSRLSPNEQYTHISLWCLLSAPLLIGCDMTQLDDFTLNLLTNDEVLEVNQDPLGRQAGRISQNGKLEVWAKDMQDGSKAVGLFNRGLREQTVTVNWSDLGISGEQTVRDLWRQKDLGSFKDQFQADVGRHGVVLVKIAPVKK